MAEFISGYRSWGSRLMFTQMNARHINEPDVYNKVITNYIIDCMHVHLVNKLF